VEQAFELGAREIGLHGGSEPLTCKQLTEHISYCRKVGFEYIYITTNGTLADETRLKNIIDAGLTSLKFSINAGDRETYTAVHGKDDFDKVMANLRFVAKYRKTLGRPLFLAVSFVEIAKNRNTFETLKVIVSPLVDEIYHTPASNQSGQMAEFPVEPSLPEICVIPFNQLNITREGYLRLCCNDYQNMLVVEDLAKMRLSDAWAGTRVRQARRRHLTGDLKGILCHNCIRGYHDPVASLNPELANFAQIAE
jgi:hypothetical protein